MNRTLQTIAIATTALGLSVAATTTASADGRWHHHGGYGWGIGAAGLATGLIVGSAIASEPRYYDGPVYYDDDYAPPPPPPGYYGAPQRYVPVAGDLRPWSPAWEQYCQSRYRTFDNRTGFFVGNDGIRHFCVPS